MTKFERSMTLLREAQIYLGGQADLSPETREWLHRVNLFTMEVYLDINMVMLRVSPEDNIEQARRDA